MSDRELRSQLSQLHDALEETPTVDASSRDLLVEILDDIQRLLESSGDDTDEDESLAERAGERLGDAVREFEEQHPTLATAIGRIADTLSNLGI